MFITRHKIKDKFIYKNCKNEDLERIKKLCIPPMWISVKVDPKPSAKVQATGYDSKGRKQYIYHKDFVEKSKIKKFKKMNTFNYARYNNVLKHYIRRCDLSKECIIANIIKIMEELNIRVGNESYKKENGSYGITTLLKKHLKGNTLTFVGKKGIAHIKCITDPKSLAFVKRILTIKGPNLFYYSTGSAISSNDLNTFLREKIQTNITCKDIRTYCANKIFLNFMSKMKLPSTVKDRKTNILKGIDYTANELGNTRKVCKDSYLNPINLNKFL